MGIVRKTRVVSAALGMALVVPFVGAAPAQAGLLDTVGGTVNGVLCTLLSCPTPPTSTVTTSLDDVRAVLRADQVSATGAGVDVAVIDSGISPVGPLAATGRLLNGPDLSVDSPDPALRHLDALGHGTAMAGIVNAVAPGSRLVNVKVGSAHGDADVTQVIAALDWVTEHAQQDGLNIRVVNLALSYDTPMPAALNALNAAADRAWRAGIVVVSAAGNDGRGDFRLSAPASNPNGIAVGGADTLGSRNRASAVVADFSAYGGVERRPDLVVPGARIASLRVPGSVLDTAYPGARRGEDLFRGSGTSQASAAVSGSVALLLQQRPGLTPAQVKALLKASADAIPRSQLVGGAGLVDVADAMARPTPATTPALVDVPGTGSIQLARGAMTISLNGLPLLGEVDVTGNPFDPATYRAHLLAGESAWTGGSWSGSTWTGGTWTGGTWTGSTWTGSTWTGSTWTGSTWTGSTWTGSTWTGSTWTGSTWTGSTWTGSTWTGSTWTGSTWTGSTWTGSTWTGSTWTGDAWG